MFRTGGQVQPQGGSHTVVLQRDAHEAFPWPVSKLWPIRLIRSAGVVMRSVFMVISFLFAWPVWFGRLLLWCLLVEEITAGHKGPEGQPGGPSKNSWGNARRGAPGLRAGTAQR
jgi:hypothetical protein